MSTDRDLIHPRDAIMRTMERIYRYRMTTTSGGNLSIRDDDDSIWTTPARLDKGSLRRDDIVRVRSDGTTDGPHRPSSEFPFHKAVYEARPDLRGIVHAHPVALVAFSICRAVPDTRLLYQARHICGSVGFAPYALPGSADLGRNIAATFTSGFDCVVLENHGVVTAGSSLQNAFERVETREFTAKTVIKASLLGAVRYLDDEAAVHPRPPALATADPGEAPPATSAEKELRRQLAEFVRRRARGGRGGKVAQLIRPRPPGHLRAPPVRPGDRQRLSRQRHRLQRHRRIARHPHHPRKLRFSPRRAARRLRRPPP
jgi:L-fuculose-phosphate aldolase